MTQQKIEQKKISLLKCIPNTLTLCNSLCGYTAILITLQAYKHTGDPAAMARVFAWSAGMILFAMIFDMFDGFSARLLNATSMHGLQMDSLADMTTFGVAPSILVAIMAHNMRNIERTGQFIPICIFCGVYLGCAALRLATYNVLAMDPDHKETGHFSGLPSPGAASAICSFILFSATEKGRLEVIFHYLPVYAMVLGFLMVSRIPYLHIGKWLASALHSPRKIAIIVFILFLWLISSFIVNPFFFPLLVINTYVIWGIVAYCAVKIGFFHQGEDNLR